MNDQSGFQFTLALLRSSSLQIDNITFRVPWVYHCSWKTTFEGKTGSILPLNKAKQPWKERNKTIDCDICCSWWWKYWSWGQWMSATRATTATLEDKYCYAWNPMYFLLFCHVFLWILILNTVSLGTQVKRNETLHCSTLARQGSKNSQTVNSPSLSNLLSILDKPTK